MYNAEQKKAFIEWFSDSVSMRNQAQYFFDTFEPYEEAWGADICTRSVEDLLPPFRKISGVRDFSKRTPLAVLRKYALWCLDYNVPGATDAALHLEDDGLDKLRKSTLKNPRHLQAWLDMLCDPESEHTSDNYLRAYCWLAYAGISEDAVLDVHASDVDFENLVVRTGNREYPIYREAIPCMRNCVNLTQFVYKHPNYGKSIIRDRVPGDALLRGVKNIPGLKTLRVEISRKAKHLRDEGKSDLTVTYNRIWLSGVFYRMYEDELAGLPVDFYNVTELGIADKELNLSSSRNTIGYKRREIANHYKTDYERWKQTLL